MFTFQFNSHNSILLLLSSEKIFVLLYERLEYGKHECVSQIRMVLGGAILPPRVVQSSFVNVSDYVLPRYVAYQY